MIAGMTHRTPKKFSLRKMARMNAEQAIINKDMVDRNLKQQARRKELEAEIASMRDTAREALNHRFSPLAWRRALEQIRGNDEQERSGVSDG